MLVDTHCHLADPAFADDVAGVVGRARAAGVVHVVVVGESPEAAGRALALCGAHDGLSATAGLHPHEAHRWGPGLEAELRALAARPEVVALGEMGLDYHYDHSPRDLQRRAFDAQLALAAEFGKPAVIHAREADDDVAALLRAHPRAVAILHSFSSGPALLRAGLDLGHYLSFSGMVTFRSWSLDDAVRATPGDRLLVETDAPYLAPVPHRGHRNEPAFVRETAHRLAEVRGVAPEELARSTTGNARTALGHRLPEPASGPAPTPTDGKTDHP